MTDFSDPVSRRIRKSAGTFDLSTFVQEAVDRFEKSTRGRVRISGAARSELVRRMQPHLSELLSRLESGKLTTKELDGVLREVLVAASTVQRKARMGRNPATGEPVKIRSVANVNRARVIAAMKWKCRLLGWC